MLRLHDTALGQVVDVRLRDEGLVSMYVCGPTVYDVPHLGHGRFSLVFDVLRRYLEWRGLEVRYVSNITDIDDNIISRANREGRTWQEVVAEYEAVWWQAMDALGVKRPTVDPHATAFVDRMVELIGALEAQGQAYETSDGVYFAAEAVADYGLLARQSIDSLQAGARVEANDEKRSPVDFALWKKTKPGEPSWPSPWGDGRPGWHTECVVMSLDLLGEGFDIHGGGLDLAFPHHENERAQAVAMGQRFATHWVHNGWVVVEGEKMSKSLANFTTLTDLLERTDARAYRLLVLRAHYRSPIEVTPATVADAEKALERLDAFARRFADQAAGAAPVDDAAVAEFIRLMDDDLQTPQAMALVFDLVSRANASADDGDATGAALTASTVFHLLAAVGLELRTTTGDVDAETARLVAERDAARAAKDFSRADALRDELQAIGWTVEDTAGGTRVYR